MSDAVKIALIALGGPAITAVASIITQVILNKKNREKRKEESEEERKAAAVEAALKEERLNTRLASIESKLDEHNGYAAKLGTIEKSIAVIENDIKTLYREGA